MSATVADAIERLDALAGERGVELWADVPLAPLTTLRVGGSADRLAAPASVNELVTVIRLARDAGVPAFLLGKGRHSRPRRPYPRRRGDDRWHDADR